MLLDKQELQARLAAEAQRGSKGLIRETKGYITNRGLDKLTAQEAALKAIGFHRNAESKLGAPADQLVRVPKEPGDPEWAKVYERLGRPKDATGYDFKAAADAGADDKFIDFFRNQALKLNLTKEQAESLAKEYVGFADAEEKSESGEKTAKLAQEHIDLDKSGGFNKTANTLIARNAAEKLGISPDAVAALEGQVGYKAVMEMFLKIGVSIGEDKFVNSIHGAGNPMTADGATERRQQLMADKDWVKRYQSGGVNSAEFKEMQNLIRLSNSGRG